MDTKTRIKYISLTLFVTVFSVWVLFYLIISQTIADSTQKQIALASGQIIERLGGKFADVERLSYCLVLLFGRTHGMIMGNDFQLTSELVSFQKTLA
ncbi:MAG TPA: hypothetical protein DEQ02_10710 [Ruminococcaceae bacterium]|nr:hypothetical protein [Oscillospiraceae bacterium]